MKVAFTSTSGERIDQHFGQTAHFHLWEVGTDRAEFVERVSAITSAPA